jgi:hypothetical protein
LLSAATLTLDGSLPLLWLQELPIASSPAGVATRHSQLKEFAPPQAPSVVVISSSNVDREFYCPPAGVEEVWPPGVGEALYTLNTAPAFLKFMYRQHVYVDANKLTPEFMQQKYNITQQPGARYAPAAFVTGTLDPTQSHEEFVQVGRSLSVPTMVVIGEQSPGQSKAEMEALAELPEIQSSRISGSLGLHEEYANEVTAIALPFLQN